MVLWWRATFLLTIGNIIMNHIIKLTETKIIIIVVVGVAIIAIIIIIITIIIIIIITKREVRKTLKQLPCCQQLLF